MERARVRSDSIDRTVAQTSKNCLRNFISKVVVRSYRLVIACSINTPMRNNFFRAEALGGTASATAGNSTSAGL